MPPEHRDPLANPSANPAASSTRPLDPHGPASPAPGAVRGFRIDVIDGPRAGVSWKSSRDRCTIGCHRSCDLVLEDDTVSRFHCEIIMEEQGARVRDLDSVNGVLIDGLRVVDAFLKNNAVLRLGRSALLFQRMVTHHALPLSEHTSFGALVGRSVRMRAVFAVLEKAAPTRTTILLEGETGTGKSAAARSIHQASQATAAGNPAGNPGDGPGSAPFVMLDCGAIPATLLESELFGHERGAFTGADSRRVGAFEDASGGTIFLDEIGELPLELQVKLLSAIENRRIRRLGGNQHMPVDVRVIAATNRDLRAEVNAGRFREDLYYRLAVVQVTLPPLRQRLEDLPLLAERVLLEQGVAPARIEAIMTPAFVHTLASNTWPGNIRELRNYLERYLIFEDALPPAAPGALAPGVPDMEGDASPRVDASLPYAEARRRCVDEFERAYMRALLDRHDGNVSRAAAAAGMERTSFYRVLRRQGIKGR